MAGNFEDEEKLSKKPYGKSFARSVIDKLIVKGESSNGMAGIYHVHRDYCGMGLFYIQKIFSICYVYEGMIAPEKSIVSFQNKEQAVDFLSRQSDYTMSGYDKTSVLKESSEFRLNNQRLTRKMLENFLSRK